MKICFQLLVAITLVFLAAALYRADYLKVPTIVSAGDAAGSILLLFAGFLVGTMCWRAMLERSGYRVSLGSCVASMGLSMFGKYVPGKLWTIAGRAAYVAQLHKESFAHLSIVSLRTQFVSLWTGLTLGVCGLCIVGGLRLWGCTAIALWVLLTVLVFSQAVQRIAAGAGRLVLRKELQMPSVDLKAMVSVLPWFALSWALWSIAFYLLVRGLVPGEILWSISLAFPLAGTLGILAVIAPGGLGVREGVLTGYLVLAGVPVADATTVAVASRLWFLIGELFMFAAGVAAHRLQARLQKQSP